MNFGDLYNEILEKYVKVKKVIGKVPYILRKNITFNEDRRARALQKNERIFQKLYEHRKRGLDKKDYFDIYMARDRLIDIHNALAYNVQGYAEVKPKGDKEITQVDDWEECEYEVKCDTLGTTIAIKKLLEEGADVKALYYKVFSDDPDYADCYDEDDPWRNEDVLRLTLNGLLYGMRLFPLFVRDETRAESGEDKPDVVFINKKDLYNQLYSIGELATIHSYEPIPAVLAMLIHAGADFMVRDGDNIEGTHAFIRTFQTDFDIDPEDKEKILEAFADVCINKKNGLTKEERAETKRLFEVCIDPQSEYYETISEGDRKLISCALDEINEKSQTIEK